MFSCKVGTRYRYPLTTGQFAFIFDTINVSYLIVYYYMNAKMANCKGNDIKLKARIYVLFLLKEQKLQYLYMFLAIILVGWIGGKCYLCKEVFWFSGLCTENEP